MLLVIGSLQLKSSFGKLNELNIKSMKMMQTNTKATPAKVPPAKVTIVVVPRECFSSTQRSLESIYQHTTVPFKLVYVDGNSPGKVRRYLEQQAREKEFKLIRTEHYLTPNQARNLGLAAVDTEYLVFFDNDVVVTPGWLQALLTCAEETEATVVGPLMCQGEPIHEIVHCAGGENHIRTDKKGRRHLREKMYLQRKHIDDVRDRLQRCETELAEFHCVLVRRSIFDRLGPLDEAMLNTKEHLDFCMNVRSVGGTVYFEPDCVVTYLLGQPLELSDLHYFMLRWSDAWQLGSLQRLRDKWSLSEDGYFQVKYKKLGWRRNKAVIKPIARQLALGRSMPRLVKLLTRLDRSFNRFLTTRHARQTQTSLNPPQSAPQPPEKAAVAKK